MAERALFSIAGQIIGSLSSPAFQEIGLVWGVNDELQKLKEMVVQLQAVLLDAEQKQANSAVQVWLESLEDAVYDADDVLDEFCAEAQRRSQIMLGCDQVSKQVRKFFSSSNRLAFRTRMGHKIKDINRRLQDIASRRTFILEELREDTRFITRERVTHSFVPTEVMVGRDVDQRAIEQLLLDPNHIENVLTISIVGFGGLGKTALTQLVFNDKVVQDHFDLRIWTTVSNVFELDIVVKKILGSESNDINQLQNELRMKVDGKRYLLILDDVWNENRQKWLSLEYLLMGGARGSRILITTRSEIVATNSGATEKYSLKGLDEEQSWSLFKKMAFKDGKEPENPIIKTAAVEIAKKCQGVPLAIRTIGGMLYSNDEEIEWLNLKNKKFSEISQQEHDITPTLKLSYDALPSDLKHCFAYCSLFPPDYEISVDMLIKLWVAQGFIKASYKNECLEDVGFAYYKELLRRSFFQEEEKDEFGKIRTCKMHDLMNELAILVAGKRSTIVDLDQEPFDENYRHISFNFYVDLSKWKIPNSMRKPTKMRTFLFLGQDNYTSFTTSLDKSFCSTIVSNFKYLRMLSLNQLGIQSLPNCLRKLKHLRYLDLSGNFINRLPNWIVGLVNLETLDLSRCSGLKELPRDIKKMVNLRHLVLKGCSRLKAMPRGMGELTCLRTLDMFVLNKDGVGLRELSRLTELRGNLEIGNLWHGKDHLSSLYDEAIVKEKHLDSLTLKWSKIKYKDVRTAQEINVFKLLEALQPHSNVKQLSVRFYSGLRFPKWFSSLINISHLKLSRCPAIQHLPPLDHFPFLQLLHLASMDSLEFIMISTPTSTLPPTFFPSLKTVVLYDCPNLKGWLMVPISSSSCSSSTAVMPSFPCLSTLTVGSCPKLTSMPLYPNLDRLELYNSSWDVLPWVVTVTRKAYDIGVSKLTSMHIEDMEYVPEGIGNLISLQNLSIRNLSDLASLPEGIGNLASLQFLSIDYCSNLEYVSDQCMGRLISLQELKIHNCPGLASVPKWIRNLPSLQQLSIMEGSTVASLPQFIGNHRSLKSLFVGDCSKSASLPEWIGNFPSLHGLVIRFFSNLVSLPEGICHLSSLNELVIDNCPNLASLPEGIGYMTSLQSLSIYNCPNLTYLPQGISHLDSLKKLIIDYCPVVKERCMKETGEDWPNIAHIPHISIM